jgi:hypothetical protein
MGKTYSDRQIIESFIQISQHGGAVLETLSDYKELIKAYNKGKLTSSQVQLFCIVCGASEDIYAKIFAINDLSVFKDMDDEIIDLYFKLN